MEIKKITGFINGIISSASFGTIPLFAIPVMLAGMEFMSVLLYRFSFATLLLGLVLILKKENLGIGLKELLPLSILSVFYIISSLFLLWGYQFMPSGVATTIHFMYPVITTLIMMFFFHEPKSYVRITAVIMAIIGVYFISRTEEKASFDWLGIIIVLLSALGYALYLVALGQLKSLKIKGMKLTFYVFLFSSIVLWIGMLTLGKVQMISDCSTFFNLLLLALVPTVVSNLTLVKAIKHIGSTLTSVLGAMEPVTAVLIGILIFDEFFTFSIGLGIVLIISSVSIIIMKK